MIVSTPPNGVAFALKLCQINLQHGKEASDLLCHNLIDAEKEAKTLNRKMMQTYTILCIQEPYIVANKIKRLNIAGFNLMYSNVPAPRACIMSSNKSPLFHVASLSTRDLTAATGRIKITGKYITILIISVYMPIANCGGGVAVENWLFVKS